MQAILAFSYLQTKMEPERKSAQVKRRSQNRSTSNRRFKNDTENAWWGTCPPNGLGSKDWLCAHGLHVTTGTRCGRGRNGPVQMQSKAGSSQAVTLPPRAATAPVADGGGNTPKGDVRRRGQRWSQRGRTDLVLLQDGTGGADLTLETYSEAFRKVPNNAFRVQKKTTEHVKIPEK